MKKSAISFLLTTALLGSLLTACSGNADKNTNVPPTGTSSPSASQEGTTTPTPDKSPEPTPTPEPDKKPEPGGKPASMSANDIITAMLEQIEQPVQLEMNDEQLKEFYYMDPDLLADFAVRMPAVNIKTNELAVLKVKDKKSMDEVKKGIEKRAKDVQKMFESYLPDQYENAKNFKIVTEGDYVLFIISESADELEDLFKSYFA